MMDIAVNFYKHLFRREDRPPISLQQDFWRQADLVLDSENERLIAPFLMEKLRMLFGVAMLMVFQVQMDSPSCFITNFGIWLR